MKKADLLLLFAAVLLAPHVWPGLAVLLAVVCFLAAILIDWSPKE